MAFLTSWWFILIIVLAVILLVLVIVGNIELKMLIAPRSYWASKIKFPPKEPVTQAEITCAENKAILREKAEMWYLEANKKNWWTISFDGLKLHATMIAKPRSTHKWALCLHGYGSFETQKNYNINCLVYCQKYFEKGYNVLIPDLRAYAKSEGTFTGMGWLERKDCLGWLEEILKVDPEAEIVVHGESMGGATVMMLSGEELPDNVKCLVQDCGFTRAWEEFAHLRRTKFHILNFPMLYVASFFSKIRAGYSFREANSLKQLKKCTKPIFFIHGSADRFVPAHMLLKNYAAAENCEKNWYSFANAKHIESKFQMPDLYWTKVFGFVNRYIH